METAAHAQPCGKAPLSPPPPPKRTKGGRPLGCIVGLYGFVGVRPSHALLQRLCHLCHLERAVGKAARHGMTGRPVNGLAGGARALTTSAACMPGNDHVRAPRPPFGQGAPNGLRINVLDQVPGLLRQCPGQRGCGRAAHLAVRACARVCVLRRPVRLSNGAIVRWGTGGVAERATSRRALQQRALQQPWATMGHRGARMLSACALWLFLSASFFQAMAVRMPGRAYGTV